jgi:mono/diheme cytochrome c family protein
MATGFLHLHSTIIIIFLAWFAYKTYLLLTNRNEALAGLKAKFRWVDPVLGVLILGTGAYLLFGKGDPDTYLKVKIVIVLALIPLGIIAVNRKNKIMAVVVLLGYFYAYAISKTHSLTLQKPDVTAQLATGNTLEAGAVIYKQECVRCHGEKGDAMIAGAKNLQITALDKVGIAEMVTNGKNTMPAYGSQLKTEEIKAVAEFVETLKK